MVGSFLVRSTGGGYGWIQVLRDFLKSSGRRAGTFLCAVACIVCIAMLLSFPATSAHNFSGHFRSNEVRRSIVRHASVAAPEADGAQAIARVDIEPTIAMPVIVESIAQPLATFEVYAEVSLIRLLLRFKLGPSRSDGSVPLL